MSTTQLERRHVRRDANFTGEQRDSLLVVEALAVKAINAGLVDDSLNEKKVAARAIDDLREVGHTWDSNPATEETWDEAQQAFVDHAGTPG